MSSRFDSIPNNAFFTADGQRYQKINLQVYADPTTKIETYWDPMFDARIELEGEPAGSPEDGKFNVDPQTRLIVPNPKYQSAEEAFKRLHESGLFGCEASDYKSMVETCLKWGKGKKKAGHGQ